MALFTDGTIAALTDLKQYESSILDVAHTENVDVEDKLDLARREIGLELTAFLLRRNASYGVRRELKSVVVTEPLLHWHAVHTLSLIYRDAYNSQLNDRYRGKWQEFAQLAERAQRLLFDIGVGLTRAPISKAEPPMLGSQFGGLLPAATYYVKLAGQSSAGTTGSWSDCVAVTVLPGSRLVVTMPVLPAGVTGGVIYAGQSEQTLTRQNDAPLGAGAVWVQPESGLRKDLATLPMQGPDFYVSRGQELFRG
jgi:hypothetical protein